MNEPIVTITRNRDTLSIVRNPDSGNFGIWLERRLNDNSLEMSGVAWLEAADARELTSAIEKTFT